MLARELDVWAKDVGEGLADLPAELIACGMNSSKMRLDTTKRAARHDASHSPTAPVRVGKTHTGRRGLRPDGKTFE